MTPDREVVTYCQGGYRAAHSYLALRLLGYPRVRNYVGSWKEWGDRDELPIETSGAALKDCRLQLARLTDCTDHDDLLMNNIIDFINVNRDRYVEELKSVPRDSQHQRAAASTPADVRALRRVDAPTRCAASACRTCG